MKTRDLTDLALRNLREALLRNTSDYARCRSRCSFARCHAVSGRWPPGACVQTALAERAIRYDCGNAKKQHAGNGGSFGSGRRTRFRQTCSRSTKTRVMRLNDCRMSSRSIRRSGFSLKFALTTNPLPPSLPACLNPRGIPAPLTACRAISFLRPPPKKLSCKSNSPRNLLRQARLHSSDKISCFVTQNARHSPLRLKTSTEAPQIRPRAEEGFRSSPENPISRLSAC